MNHSAFNIRPERSVLGVQYCPEEMPLGAALTIIGFDYVGLLLAQHDEVVALASPEPLALPTSDEIKRGA